MFKDNIMKKILITGANGFIGTELTKTIKNHISVIRENSKCSDSESNNIIYIPSLDSSVDWIRLIPKDVDAVIHLAGIAHNKTNEESDYYHINVEGTLHLAKSAIALGIKRFVYVSSIGVNGHTSSAKPFSCNDKPAPNNIYSQSKLSAEKLLLDLASQNELEVVIVRPTLVYGIDAPGNFGLLKKLVKFLPVLPFGAANNARDFISVQNLSDLLYVCAIHPDAPGNIFLASDGKSISTKQFTNEIAMGMGKKIIQLYIPKCLFKIIGKILNKSDMIEQLFGDLEVDITPSKEILHWHPPFTISESMKSFKTERSSNNDKNF